MSRIAVSANRRYFVDEKGQPFFYLADTAWELFHRTSVADATYYLTDRAAKRFTVIQAVLLGEFDGLITPNTNGHAPFHELDPQRPCEEYFAHCDRLIAIAAALGLHIGLLPTWGDKWNLKWGVGPVVFTPENARHYGEFVGRRYRDQPVIWIMGGDRPIEVPAHRAIMDAMAEGIRAGDGGRNLMTFHPCGGTGSVDFVADAPWIDFHMRQSGHKRNGPNWEVIASDYQRADVKPCLDGEPGYEDHPASFDLENGYLDDYDARKAAYWSVFAGACGHTYGCHSIWGFWQPPLKAISFQRTEWRAALQLPGAANMRHLRALIESRPQLTRVPDQALLASEPGAGTHHVQATRDEGGRYAFIYLASIKEPVRIDTTRLSGQEWNVHWYDPRNGVATAAGIVKGRQIHEFTPPNIWPDWVLVLDDVAAGYGVPGQEVYRQE